MLNAIVLLAATVGSITKESPSDSEVLRALPRITRGVPFVFEQFRDDITVVKKVMHEQSVYLTATGAIRVVRWECEVRCADTLQTMIPFPLTLTNNRAQVINIEKVERVK